MSVCVAFAGGGTGGHIYPGIAVASQLKNLAAEHNTELRIFWFGNSKGMDREIVEKSSDVDVFVGIPSGKLRRYFSLKNFADIFKIIAGFFVSFFKLLKIKPAVLFSKGGFVSVPPCIAAKILKIPVFTHECDFTPGLATKINSRFAEKILVSYDETRKFFSERMQNKILVTGNPVRQAFYSANPEEGKKFIFGGKKVDGTKPVLTVLGGSLGAHQINELTVENLDWLTERFYVVHQCGKADENFVPKRADSYFPFPFIYSQMPDVVAASDVILSRAGANSIWESAAARKAQVLIPLSGNGTRGDQVDNARFFEKNGAAKVLLGGDISSEKLKEVLTLLLNADERKKLTDASKKLLPENAVPAAVIAEEIFNSMQKQRRF